MVAFAGLICDVKMSSSPLTLGQNLFHLFVSRQVRFCLSLSLSCFWFYLSFSSLCFGLWIIILLYSGNEDILYASHGNEIKSFDVHMVKEKSKL